MIKLILAFLFSLLSSFIIKAQDSCTNITIAHIGPSDAIIYPIRVTNNCNLSFRDSSKMNELQSILYNILSFYTHQSSSEFFNNLKDYLVATLSPVDTLVERQLNGEWGSVGIYLKDNFEKKSVLFLGNRETSLLVLKKIVAYLKVATDSEEEYKNLSQQLNALIHRLSE